MIDRQNPASDRRLPHYAHEEPNENWLISRRKLGELMKSGATPVTSASMFAMDTGKGVYTIGIGSCVGIASSTGIAHIPLFQPYGESQIKKVKQVLSNFSGEQVILFGLKSSNFILLNTITTWLKEQRTTITNTHTTKSLQDSFTIMLKDKNVSWFVDNGSFRS